MLLAGNGLMELEFVAPEGLAAERVVPKRLSPPLDHLLGMVFDETISSRRCRRHTLVAASSRLRIGRRVGLDTELPPTSENQDRGENCEENTSRPCQRHEILLADAVIFKMMSDALNRLRRQRSRAEQLVCQWLAGTNYRLTTRCARRRPRIRRRAVS